MLYYSLTQTKLNLGQMGVSNETVYKNNRNHHRNSNGLNGYKGNCIGINGNLMVSTGYVRLYWWDVTRRTVTNWTPFNSNGKRPKTLLGDFVMFLIVKS